VVVQIPDAPSDPGFAAFRAEFAAVAKRRVYAELARLVVARGFFWERDFSHKLDPRRSGVENLAAAVGLEHGDGSGWTTLALFAAEASAAAIDGRPGVICGPARARFDDAEFNALIARTGSDAVDWAYPRAAALAVRASADMAGVVVETLGLHFVRLRRYAAKDGEPLPARTAWTHIATPAGRTGFVAPGTLLSPYAERLCYARDITGRWRITGFVGIGD
jgi:hypothetical protein